MSTSFMQPEILAFRLGEGTGPPEIAWREKKAAPTMSSSPLFADGHVSIGSRDGRTFVLRPGPTYEVEAINQLDGQIFATPAALGRALYVRTDLALYRIENGSAAADS